MNIPTSWQLDNCVPAGELWLPAACLPVSLCISCFWGAGSYFLPPLSVALLGFWVFFLKLRRHFFADQFVDEKSICNRSQLGG